MWNCFTSWTKTNSVTKWQNRRRTVSCTRRTSAAAIPATDTRRYCRMMLRPMRRCFWKRWILPLWSTALSGERIRKRHHTSIIRSAWPIFSPRKVVWRILPFYRFGWFRLCSCGWLIDWWPACSRAFMWLSVDWLMKTWLLHFACPFRSLFLILVFLLAFSHRAHYCTIQWRTRTQHWMKLKCISGAASGGLSRR